MKVKPITEDFIARIFLMDGHEVVYKKTRDGYEFVGALKSVAVLANEQANKIKERKKDESKMSRMWRRVPSNY